MARAYLTAVLALCLVLGVACASRWDAAIPPRTVGLVLAVDEAFRFHADWERDLREAVRTVSGIFERHAGIRLEARRIEPWQSPALGDGSVLDHVLIMAHPAQDDVVVGVSGGCDHAHAGRARIFSRVALVTTGCKPFLQARTPTLEHLLAHEIAHLFGMFHPAPGVQSVMRGGAPDDWDSQTVRVVRLMRGFDFVRGVESLDERTRAAYARIYDEGHDPDDANGIAVAIRNEGRVLLDGGAVTAARARFETAAAVDPRWYQPYVDLGAWHAAQQQPAEAARFFRAAAERATGAKPDTRLQLARRLESLADDDGALHVYEATVRAVPRSAEARLRLGSALLRRGRAGDAEPHLREAVRLAPDSADTHGQLGAALGVLGRTEDSIAESRRAVSLKPDWATARGNLGYGLAQAGRLDDALVEYRAALALDPADRRTRYNLVDALIRTSRADEAVTESRALVTREPTSTQAWQHLIAALMLARRYPEAQAEVQRAGAAGVVIPAALQEQLRREQGTAR